jgi:5-enolpyruvylshikimate-3-phosphate synthase
MMGILAGQSFISRLTGDASLNRRPVERVALPLRAMGAEIEELRASPAERVVKVAGRPLKGIRYELPMASAQVKSAVLLAGLFAQGETEVVEKVPSRDHTEIMLRERGAAIRKEGGD